MTTNTDKNYSEKELFELIKDDMLVSMYNNPILREQKAEIGQTYFYLYGKRIDESKLVAPVLTINPEKTESVFSKVAFDTTQSFGFDFITNADLKTKKLHKVLIHSIRADHESAGDKIQALYNLLDNAVLVSFFNLDNAKPEVISQINDFIKNQPDNIFCGFESKTNVPALEGVERIGQLSAIEHKNQVVKAIKIK